MGTVVHALTPFDASFPGANPAGFKVVAGTNFPVESLAFDASTEETCYFKFRAVKYAGGDVTVRLRWYADTASSGGVAFGASVAAITPNTDTQDIETKAFDTETVGTDSHIGTTGQRLHETTITVPAADTDGMAEDDWCVLRLARKVADGGDDMTGDAHVVACDIEYSDT